MKKIDKYYDSLMGHEVEDVDGGEVGYVVTLGELIDNGGRDEFFRIWRKNMADGVKTSRDVYHGLEYDREDRKWYADAYTGYIGQCKGMTRKTKVFIGFTY